MVLPVQYFVLRYCYSLVAVQQYADKGEDDDRRISARQTRLAVGEKKKLLFQNINFRTCGKSDRAVRVSRPLFS